VAYACPARLRLAEVISALSLATDLGLGQPLAHALRTCVFALRLGRALSLSDRGLADIYYTTLLRFIGCTSESHELLAFTAGDDVGFRHVMVAVGNDTPAEIAAHLTRFMTAAEVHSDVRGIRDALESDVGLGAQLAVAHCEVATMLATRLGLGATVCNALAHAFERWDGRGFPGGRSGEEIPLPVRVAVVARDIEVLTRTEGVEQMRDAFRRRRDRSYDPRLVDAFLEHRGDVLAPVDDRTIWDDVLRAEPGGPVWIPSERIDAALTAFADFADAKTPFTLDHSRRVAELAETAARDLGLSSHDSTAVRRAALLHDIGRSGIANAIWEQRGALSVAQWERVRLHVYYTERILAHCDDLRALCALASSHHERLDGSGYHRGTRGADLDMPARVLAAADACQAMLQERPHRPARKLDDVVRELRRESSSGRLDGRVVEAVLAAAGAPAGRPSGTNPAKLTDREVEVLRLMARGHSNREMARSLNITPKTVGHHVQHIYDKIGVSTRAAAAVFAVENHLL
jgi:putative nucleotidyltransferase with HDIG domain